MTVKLVCLKLQPHVHNTHITVSVTQQGEQQHLLYQRRHAIRVSEEKCVPSDKH